MVPKASPFRALSGSPQHAGWLTRLAHRFTGQRSLQPDRVLIATVEEALTLPGCPLCRLLAERELRGLESILWEQVTDPETHQVLLAARGFCFIHSWALVPAGHRVFNHHSVAIILQRILVDLLQAIAIGGVAGAQRWLTPQTPCLACVWESQREEMLLEALAWIGFRKPELLTDGPALLCHPHTQQLANMLDKLYPAQLARWHMLVQTLTARQMRSLREISVEEQLAQIVGRRPPYLPVQAEYCPQCQNQRAQLLTNTSWIARRAFAWTVYLDAPHLVVATLNNAGGIPTVLAPSQIHLEANVSVAPRCLGHLRQALAQPNAPYILEETASALESLAAQVQRFIASADYRFTGKLTDEERTSWRNLIAVFAGETPGTSLHDLEENVRRQGRRSHAARRT